MRRYTIVIEKADNNFAAYAPDLPGCITTGETADETKANMQEAIAQHLEVMEELGIPIPEPSMEIDAVPAGSDAYLVEIAG